MVGRPQDIARANPSLNYKVWDSYTLNLYKGGHPTEYLEKALLYSPQGFLITEEAVGLRAAVFRERKDTSLSCALLSEILPRYGSCQQPVRDLHTWEVRGGDGGLEGSVHQGEKLSKEVSEWSWERH